MRVSTNRFPVSTISTLNLIPINKANTHLFLYHDPSFYHWRTSTHKNETKSESNSRQSQIDCGKKTEALKFLIDWEVFNSISHKRLRNFCSTTWKFNWTLSERREKCLGRFFVLTNFCTRKSHKSTLAACDFWYVNYNSMISVQVCVLSTLIITSFKAFLGDEKENLNCLLLMTTFTLSLF